MAEVQRNVPIAAEMSLLRKVASDRGNARSWYAPIGRFNADDATFRDLLRWAFAWAGDVYQLKHAWLDLYGVDGGPAAVSGFGSSPAISLRALTGSFTAFGGIAPGSVYSDWTEGAATVFGGPVVTGTTVNSGTIAAPAGRVRIDVVALVEAIAPARVLKRDGTPCDGATHNGWRVFSDEADQTKRWTYSAFVEGHTRNPTLTLVFDDNQPPPAPVPVLVNGQPADTGSTTTIDSLDARRLTVEFTSSPRAGDTTDRVELTVYAAGATAVDFETNPAQPVTGTQIATTGTVAPTSTGQLNHFTGALTGLRPRETQLYRLRVRNQKGAWGPWTPLSEGSIFSAYTPGIPLDPRMTSDPTGPVVSATLSTQDPLDGVIGLRGTFVRHNADGSTTNLWPDVDSTGIGIAYVAGAKRAVVPWRGVSLNDGDTVSWRVSLRSRDGVWSPLTAEVTTTMRTVVGPTITPADATTKLTSRTTGVSIDDPIEFDAHRYRLYRNDVLFYSSPVIAVEPPATTADITFPAGLLNWGDTFGIEDETRPTDTSVFGPTSTRAVLYVNTLPRTSATAKTEDGITGDILPVEDIVFGAPYVDVDAARYGERPVAKLLEVRHAATPQGSGALVDQRLGIEALKTIPEDEHSGYQFVPLTTSVGVDASGDGSAAISIGTVADRPTDYTGSSLLVTFTAMSDDGGVYLPELDPPLDLRGFSSHAFQMIWRKLSSEANLDHIAIGFQDTAGKFAEWTIYDPASDATGSWVAEFPTLGFPSYFDADFDWSSVQWIYIWAYVTGSFSANLRLRDWRIGFEVKDSTPPDATFGIAFENNYDYRERYRDDADALATTQLAAASLAGATNVKVESIASLVVGQDLTVGDDDERFQETRVISIVGTAGSGGTGVTLDEALFYAHADDSAVNVYPWGLWTGWRTVRSSAPPTVAAVSPADAATITDPTSALVHTFSSPGGKAQALRTMRIYARDDGVDRLVYERDVAGTGTTTTVPVLLLDDATEYAWEIVAYDTDGLPGTTTRRTFTTALTTPDPVEDLAATSATATSTVTLTWTASDDAHLAFYVVRWRDADGQLQRVDLGPRAVDDERTPLEAATFTHRGARLGVNVYQVSVHNGVLESDPEEVEVTLQPARPAAWMLADDDDRGIAYAIDPSSAARRPMSTVETLRPPGRPYPVHLHWGLSGTHVSLKVDYLPSDPSLARAVAGMLHDGRPVWVKAPSPYGWDPIRSRVVDAGPENAQQSNLDVSIELDEIAPEAPG